MVRGVEGEMGDFGEVGKGTHRSIAVIRGATQAPAVAADATSPVILLPKCFVFHFSLASALNIPLRLLKGSANPAAVLPLVSPSNRPVEYC